MKRTLPFLWAVLALFAVPSVLLGLLFWCEALIGLKAGAEARWMVTVLGMTGGIIAAWLVFMTETGVEL